MAAEDLGGDRDFRYPLSLLRVAYHGLLAATAFTYLVIFGVVVPLVAARAASPGMRASLSPVMVAIGVGCIPLFIVSLCELAYDFALSRRASVLLTRVGVTVTDWRGREERIFWDDVEELRTSRRRWQPAFRKSSLVLIGGECEVAIVRGVEARNELRDEIVARAGLVSTGDPWGRERYIRPESP